MKFTLNKNLATLGISMILASGVSAAPIRLIDFASVVGSTPGNWNNLNSGTSLSNLIDSTGAPTTVDLTLSFNGTGTGFGGGAFNNGDSSAPAPFNIASAYGDGLYSNNHLQAGIDLIFSDLAVNSPYTITFYGGRNDGNWADADVSVTTGSGTGGKVTHRTATAFTVTSDASGTIVLNFVDDGVNNASAANATISALSIEGASSGLPTIESFSVNDQYVTPGSAVTFNWQTTNATTITIDQSVGDVTDLSIDGDGNINASVAATAIYTLTATGSEGSSTSTLKVTAGPERPNILFFIVDDMGANDTSVPFQVDGSGNDVVSTPNGIYHTPNMAALAAQGMKFTRSYAMPVCTPTRTSYMTGQNSARHHVTTWTGTSFNEETGQNSTPSHNSPLNWRRTGFDNASPSLAKILSEAGYRSIHVGKGHFGNAPDNIDPLDIGFDINIGGKQTGRPGSFYGTSNFGSGLYQVPHMEAYHGQNIFLTEALTLEMNKEIEKSVNAGVPFFAYMSHYAVHDPYHADPRFTGNPKYAGLSGNDLAFATMLEGMDKSLGDIRAKLAALGVAEDTLVIFVSDNGSTKPLGSDPLRGYKGQKYEGGTRVPMIASWSAPNAANSFQSNLAIPANSHEDDIVTCFDIFPTILSVANVSHNNIVDGYDLSNYLKGASGTHRPQEVVIHFPHDHNGAWGDYFTAFYEGDYKLIYNFASDSYELYNVITDVHEDNNLASADPNRVMAMARKMARQLNAQGAQWPTFDTSPTDTEDPFAMPVLTGVDLDNDGLNDNSEDTNGNGLVDSGETDPDNENTDGDNMNDGDEASLGIDPLDPNSYFFLKPAKQANGEFHITWPSAPGASFTIRSSTDLIDWTTEEATDVPASAGNTTSFNTGTPGTSKRFYRTELD